MNNKEARDAWGKLYSVIDKDNWLFVGTINPDMVAHAIKALTIVNSLFDMKDNAYMLYRAEDGKSDYSYGRKQVLGTVHSDLEELLEGFYKGGRE